MIQTMAATSTGKRMVLPLDVRSSLERTGFGISENAQCGALRQGSVARKSLHDDRILFTLRIYDEGEGMAERLNGKRCLVTGAAQGIGLAIAHAFAREGARVLATDIRLEALRAAGLPDGIRLERLDVTDALAAGEVVTKAGRTDVLVNCAGYVGVGDLLACTEQDLRRSLEINVLSVFNLSRAVLPGMIENGGGHIINIASVVSTTKTAPNRFAYASTKAAVLAMTRCIALDYVGKGIRCNSISPGTVDTPSLHERIAAGADPERLREQMIARQPMGRFGAAAEIAEAAVFLASDEARFMTGADLVIDGGMSL
ncbi:MAG TPA: SDR family oxidoreductase [Pseudomonadales bacterium]